jgi:hypothetical protein
MGRGGNEREIMQAQTKIQIECAMLKVEHSIRHNTNNQSAFSFRATLPGYSADERLALEAQADIYAENAAKDRAELDCLKRALAQYTN